MLTRHGTTPIIVLSLATNREDKGQTENYRVFGGGGTSLVTNKRGERVQKSTILGGNGTVYIINDEAKDHDEWVLVPKKFFDDLMRSSGAASKAKSDLTLKKKGK